MKKAKLEEVQFLWCPITNQQLIPVNEVTLEEINQTISDQTLHHYDGREVNEPIEFGYINEDETLVYPVKGGIILALKSFAIIMDQEKIAPSPDNDFYKSIVKDFYDEYGWSQEENKDFVDARLFEDLREVSREYISNCRLRTNNQLKGSGRYLLDVASGPIQYDEYLTYSEQYDHRICMDISYQALDQARKKLGDSGIYILGDLTEMPVRDDTIDSAISLHTVYHIHKDQQEKAIRELHRVTKPGSSAVVVYSWGWHSMFMNIAILPVRVIRAFGRIINLVTRNLIRKKIIEKQAGLYFYAHSNKWLKKLDLPFRVEVKVWRSLHTDFLKLYAHRALLGKRLLKCIWNLEERYPRTMGKIGAYPMLILKK